LHPNEHEPDCSRDEGQSRESGGSKEVPGCLRNGLKIQNGGFGMSDSNPDIALLSQRISALEKVNRRWRMGGLFLFILLVAAASLTGYRAYAQLRAPAMPKAVASAVAAREFVLMGANGQIMGRIAVIDGKPALQFYDSTGQLWWYAPPKMGVVPVKDK
jgi:hypothetical protein